MALISEYKRYRALYHAIGSCIEQGILPVLKDKVMLDLGAGNGIGVKALSAFGAKAIGVDKYSLAILRPEQTFGPVDYIGLIKADIRNLPIRMDRVDGIASFLSPVTISRSFRGGLIRIAKQMNPGSFVIGSVFIPEEMHDLEMTLSRCGVEGTIQRNRWAIPCPLSGYTPDSWIYAGRK